MLARVIARKNGGEVMSKIQETREVLEVTGTVVGILIGLIEIFGGGSKSDEKS